MRDKGREKNISVLVDLSEGTTGDRRRKENDIKIYFI
jgi:hypothetical protein